MIWVDFSGVDAVRYFVLHEMPFENDGDHPGADGRGLNSDLANTLVTWQTVPSPCPTNILTVVTKTRCKEDVTPI